ncbi:MAG: tRNA guanosine(15) transglycosylase TgtA [Candidatus Thermoplasmatota archaeon]|nr:tRNA guanosine(15) transglycosylase TgtA [Candidatus Thermoplasmatota archaeon]MBU1942000.1 tRNA guanosine(15) transglycosylase TgtA [Candidatus Thermoplasmatota archaeon]
MVFEIKARDAAGRLGKFSTPHGTITTPALLPVINPNKLLISPQELQQQFGIEILITNSYIIYKDSNLHQHALENGLHHLLNFSGPIMTDSGAFQSYVYGSVSIDPLEIVRFQHDIGSDIGTILDIFSKPDQTKGEARAAVQETIKRAKMSVSEKKEMLLALPIQGALYPDLRTLCAQKMSQLDAGVFPIGGVVPLMEGQRYADLVHVILAAKQGLDPSKPVHLFGAGHPLLFPLAVALGCDLFDSASYAKFAQDNRLLFSWGTEHLSNLTELPCSCPICSKYSVEELLQETPMSRTQLLAKHNLYVCQAEIRHIRTAITRGNLWELVEQRAIQNPYLFNAVHQLKKTSYFKWLEQQESITKDAALKYSGTFTIYQPLLRRLNHRLLTHYTPPSQNALILPPTQSPYFKRYQNEIQAILQKDPTTTILMNSPMGPVPLELDEMYPYAQSEFPENPDGETRLITKKFIQKFIKHHHFNEINLIDVLLKHNDLTNIITLLDIRRVAAVADMQFGKGYGKILLQPPVEILKSKKTGKIRRVLSKNHHVLSMRAQDGLFTLKIAGGTALHKNCSPPFLRVVVDDEASPFVQEGKSVFSKFVVSCDPNLRPYDECLIVDQNDTLLAVGRCLLTAQEMQSFTVGVAVKTREHISV